ncbi:MAG TPA: class I SAM-dependent methyltransferase [Cyanobacteria bacterium UBA11149]|nr:class I SAM-dependent methyltransferase [Cyanobacteria bacterium UBA11367]HBE60096.1 class I SAM-dependent methyltransferase [Cyanobacteria bacterium UBA11366]HBK62671.1 class I SAM-dependent methyltransferase [Cyanobacteria bacterium UBA11166]HBR73219.1 class I SAM-dependent methyltransferase [Cyanobacteria bacterium UBA11159]HBS71626.1 class I SAM-dependent methyltransferase [Cyanobacteria bacterium UBA11153]HBW90802.1 class I SAM-dependent methyltransferase [Cyanobacteria bacterium UBA11
MDYGYQEDLAYIHDVGFGSFAAQSTPGLLQILRQKGIENGLVVDLGCGSGIWAKALTQAGYDVLGVDISEAMLCLAKEKAPQAKFQQESLLKFNVPTCDAVTSIGECLNYQFDEHGLADIQKLFARIYKSLKPGGLFIFDILEPGSLSGTNPQKTYAQGPDWAILLEKSENFQDKTLTRKMTIFRQVGNLYRRSEEIHTVKLYKGSEIAKQLRQVGFRVRIIRSYGEFRFRKALVGFIAAK